MGEHSLFPASERERDTLLNRISALRGHVMSAGEWRSMFSAARQLIPRKRKLAIDPSQLDLGSYAVSFEGKILSATLTAFSSIDTFNSNKRYELREWISLARDFYGLVLYLRPIPTLEFGAQILIAAKAESDDTFVSALSVVGRNEPMLARQIASRSDIERWHQTLVERLTESFSTGEDYEGLASEGEVRQDDYDSWFAQAEDTVGLVEEFFTAFNYPLPTEVARVKSLMEDIDRPPDPDSRDYEPSERSASGRPDPDFWSIDRLFEDL